ncbi:MAG: hypothetical protein R2687_03165 [Candidatus Nanopelagicales bacterium]
MPAIALTSRTQVEHAAGPHLAARDQVFEQLPCGDDGQRTITATAHAVVPLVRTAQTTIAPATSNAPGRIGTTVP